MLAILVAASMTCAPFAQVDQALKSMGETIVLMGKTPDGYVVVYAAGDGSTWTLVTVEPGAEGEKTCLISSGEGIRFAKTAKGA